MENEEPLMENIEQEVEAIWAEASKGREGYISSDLKDAAKQGIRIALERYKPAAVHHYHVRQKLT